MSRIVNPFMSAWFSAANRIAGAMRSQAAAQFQRQFNAMAKQANRDCFRLWSEAVTGAATWKGRKR
ncbi:hypothetical protein RQP53_09415 [Paucibacter sp. APW11]|uniref:Phasin domain-containing protein n=1 Tax=Roseateles aquae TaxID=3077235 RepID=A0ABU3PA96_9BURK|nr:hypothetical protein [Paucibacter sp. APW11]MDT8999483.1 hypothetical protein [Paucibacter sp. APW11]